MDDPTTSIVPASPENGSLSRWISNSHPDMVKPLITASNILRSQPILIKFILLPLFCLVVLLAIPVIIVAVVVHKVAEPKAGKGAVQVEASKTAVVTAIMRYILFHLHLCNDNLAHYFLPLPIRILCEGIVNLARITGSIQPTILTIGLLQIRTELGDELIRRFVMKHGGKQVVLLGAGFDSKAYRLDCIKSQKYDVKFFEVDIISTQTKKLQLLDANRIKRSHVTFVPVDFSVETFTECLLKKGWKQDEPTVFIWEGVSGYLPPQAVHDTLNAVGKCASGSYIFFDGIEDFVTEEGQKRIDLFPSARWTVETVKSRGEPFQWGFEDTSREGVGKFLTQFNLELVEHISAKEAKEIFMTNVDGKVIANSSTFSINVIARVP